MTPHQYTQRLKRIQERKRRRAILKDVRRDDWRKWL